MSERRLQPRIRPRRRGGEEWRYLIAISDSVAQSALRINEPLWIFQCTTLSVFAGIFCLQNESSVADSRPIQNNWASYVKFASLSSRKQIAQSLRNVALHLSISSPGLFRFCFELCSFYMKSGLKVDERGEKCKPRPRFMSTLPPRICCIPACCCCSCNCCCCCSTQTHHVHTWRSDRLHL